VGQTIACTNQKGGVGKTTTVVNLATYLALLGDRVLVIDLDPQGNATSGFGVDRNSIGGSMYDALVDGRPLAGLHRPTPVEGVRLVPSSIALAGAEVELATVDGRERRLSRALDAEREAWDWILVDCPPSLGILTVNALTGADAVLVPIQCEYYALEGLTQLIATINLVRDHLNPHLAITGVLLTMFDSRTNLSTEVAAEVRRHLHEAVFDTVVPRSVRLSEAPSHGLPIALYRPESKGAEAYRDLAREVRARGGRSGARSDTDSGSGEATRRVRASDVLAGIGA
jgi:chromosome partitioning protein